MLSAVKIWIKIVPTQDDPVLILKIFLLFLVCLTPSIQFPITRINIEISVFLAFYASLGMKIAFLFFSKLLVLILDEVNLFRFGVLNVVFLLES